MIYLSYKEINRSLFMKEDILCAVSPFRVF